MDRHELIKALAKRLKAENHSNELNKALTHSSFPDTAELDNNSRYIFLGQFAFRGYVADILYTYTPGSGTQLQHLLGNLFKNEHLHSLYDKLKLNELIRCGTEFEHIKHKHIFVFGLLGFINQFSPDQVKKQFVSRNFILPNKHLFNHQVNNNDFQAQCNVLSRILFQEPVFIEIVRTENGLWQTTVLIKDSIIARETSVSHRYSKQKTLKKALKQLADDVYFIESTKPEFDAKQSKLQQIRDTKFQQKKEEKLQLQAEKEERKRTENLIKKEKRKADKEELDAKRRITKAEVKKKKESKKGKNTIYRDYSTDEIAAMNPAKRRRLEDLGILIRQK
ncbi:MAG: hypothetical protein WCK78_16130 [Paludibacter sp.]